MDHSSHRSIGYMSYEQFTWLTPITLVVPIQWSGLFQCDRGSGLQRRGSGLHVWCGMTAKRRMTPRGTVQSFYCNLRHDRSIEEERRDRDLLRNSLAVFFLAVAREVGHET